MMLKNTRNKFQLNDLYKLNLYNYYKLVIFLSQSRLQSAHRFDRLSRSGSSLFSIFIYYVYNYFLNVSRYFSMDSQQQTNQQYD